MDPKHPGYIKEQVANIKAAIKLYEEGKIDGVNTVYLHDGKIISEEESYTTPWCAMEGGHHFQCAQKQTYNYRTLDPNHHEVRKKSIRFSNIGETEHVSEIGTGMSVVCRRFLRPSHPC